LARTEATAAEVAAIGAFDALTVGTAEVDDHAEGAGHCGSAGSQAASHRRKSEVLNPDCVHSESPSEIGKPKF
jgi:hypothetical protein